MLVTKRDAHRRTALREVRKPNGGIVDDLPPFVADSHGGDGGRVGVVALAARDREKDACLSCRRKRCQCQEINGKREMRRRRVL